MEFTGRKKVHIVPVGFEIDRIVEPLKQIGADKVYLISGNPTKKPDEDKKAQRYVD